METKHDQDELVTAELVSASGFFDQRDSVRVSLVERILSPQNLHRMMLAGGILLVAGLVVWLWSIGLFDNPALVAVVAGVGNLGLIGTGIWMLKRTRYKIAGRGLTLLGSLVMPLNLWLYDSQHLIVLDEGGQLWIPALFCSVIYAAIARVTRDSMFVYTLVGGIVMTGMLFLAGAPGNAFWIVLPMSTFFISVGAIAIHADRWFKEEKGAFSRNEFGLAFYRAGHLVLFAGLALLLGGHFSTAVIEFCSIVGSGFESPEILFDRKGQLWTLALLIGAGYNYVFSSLSDRCSSLTKMLTGVIGIATLIQTVNLLNISITLNIGLILLALLVVAANVASIVFGKIVLAKKQMPGAQTVVAVKDFWPEFVLPLVSIGLVSFGVVRYFCGMFDDGTMFGGIMPVIQLLTAGLASVTLPSLWKNKSDSALIPFSQLALIVGIGGMMIGFMSGLFGLGLASASVLLCVGAVVPVGLALASIAFPPSRTLEQICLATLSASFSVAALWVLFLSIPSTGVVFHSLLSMAFIGLLGVAFGIIGLASAQKSSILLTLFTVLTLIVQLFVFFNWTGPYTIITSITVLGLALLAARYVMGELARQSSSRGLTEQKLARTAASQLLERFAFSTILLGSSAAVLYVTFAVFGDEGELAHIGLLATQLFALGLGYVSTKEKAWKQSFIGAAALIVMTCVLTMMTISTLTIVQRLELGALASGALMVIAGYIGWSREDSPQPGKVASNEMVTIGLGVGSFLLAMPMIVGLVFDRIDGGDMIYAWRGLHEIGGLVVGIILLGSGILCRVRSTTLAGSLLLAVVVVSNLLLIQFPEQLRNTSVLMMIGGGVFFGTAVLLSMYRDRLIRLPEKIREGKGVFAVLKWR
ncbi:MAG: hypothetical protein AB8B55_20195 [Mariniblastus sp.]